MKRPAAPTAVLALLRDNGRLARAEGVRVGADDILELGPQARFMRLEFDDGSSARFRPDTRVWLAPRLAGDRVPSAARARRACTCRRAG